MSEWKKVLPNLLFVSTLVSIALTASVEHDLMKDTEATYEQSEASHDINETHYGNETHHGNGTHHGEHHGIHVASINFDYVKQPLIVTLFMLAVVICKIGKYKCSISISVFLHAERKQLEVTADGYF